MDDDETRTGGIPHYLTATGEDAIPCLMCGMPRRFCQGEAGGASWRAKPDHVYFPDRSGQWPKKYR